MTYVNCLISGDDYLKKHSDFKLIGRKLELAALSAILMRQHSNSVLLVGPGGVGASALCLGLEGLKNDPDAPLDIISKRKFWLNTDDLFASGNPEVIKDSFNKALATLSRTPESLLIVDDMNDFITAASNHGCSSMINGLMRDIKAKKFQAILEVKDDNLDPVLKCHSDMRELFTLMDLQEPDDADLAQIVDASRATLEKFHGIKISPEALQTAIDVTNKYRAKDASLSRAQPERAITLIDRALVSYRQQAHAKAPEIVEIEKKLKKINDAMAGKGNGNNEFKSLSAEDLVKVKNEAETSLTEAQTRWAEFRKKLKRFGDDQALAEKNIRALELELTKTEEKERAEQAAFKARAKTGEKATAVEDFDHAASVGGLESPALIEIRSKIARYNDAAKKNKTDYDKLMAEFNGKLMLGRDHVLAQFSKLSGIPVQRLDQDERLKLLNLEASLKQRVLDQDHAIGPLSEAICSARVGLVDKNKPQASFFFLGPSGVGKTETGKALAEYLFDDPSALFVLDMSDYMEKHAVAKMIGAPPGYEGFEAGGILTNGIRRRPYCVVLLDEVEKAHPDVFNVLLQILDEGRLHDNVGRAVSFANTVVLMTSNIGSEFFLDPNLPFEEARKLAIEELGKKFRPEFLNRFNGRQNIKCFNALSLPAIEKIAAREIAKMNGKIASQGLSVSMDTADIAAMCADKYVPAYGARGIVGFIKSHLEGPLSRVILETPDAKGTIKVSYDKAEGILKVAPPPPPEEKPKSAPSTVVPFTPAAAAPATPPTAAFG